MIQEINIDGRLHWQYGYVDGKSGNTRFHYDTEEIRRLRLGLNVKFLDYWQFNSAIDIEDDQAPNGRERDHDLQYADIDYATITLNAQKMFGITSLDALTISFGKHKVSGSAEYAISSRRIKTIERSALSNYVSPPGSTGLRISAKHGNLNFAVGIFSADQEPEFSEFNSANDYFYTLDLGYKSTTPRFFEKSRFDLRVIVNGNENANASSNPVSSGNYERKWSASFSNTSTIGKFNLLTDFIYGKNGNEAAASREGSFMGLVVLPSYWLLDDRLEAVFRYQYATSSRGQGIRLNSRYARKAGSVRTIPSLANGRGDKLHSLYLGLNYYLCSDNAKIMLGVEYDNLQSSSTDIYQGISSWIAFRTYF